MLFYLSNRLASNDTIDSVLRHREVGRAKDLSAPGNSTAKRSSAIGSRTSSYHLKNLSYRNIVVWKKKTDKIRCPNIAFKTSFVSNLMCEGCPESIQPFWISREPVAWPWYNLAAGQRRPYCVSVNSHSPVGLVSRQWDAIYWACVLCDRRIHNDRESRSVNLH